MIRKKQKENQKCVLGLATGSSPIAVYEELVRMHREEGLSFENVITFNLDEYYGLEKTHKESYYYFMHHHLFNHVNIPAENVNIPSGTVALEELEQWCDDYERKIGAAGGLDFQLLGIGRTGHIGFNEPGSAIDSKTRVVSLAHITKEDAADDFEGIENVPATAVTMGIGTVRSAKRIVLLAWGAKKSKIVKEAIEEEISSNVPATYLRQHPNTTFVFDEEAASKLSSHHLENQDLYEPCD